MIRKVFLALLILNVAGCQSVLGKMFPTVKHSSQVRREHLEDTRQNYAEYLAKAEEICQRDPKPKGFNNYRAAEPIHNDLAKVKLTPELGYSVIRCKLTHYMYQRAYKTTVRMILEFPELVRPRFLELKIHMLNEKWLGYNPWAEVKEALASLQAEYPGQEQQLVREIEELIAEGVAVGVRKLAYEKRKKDSVYNLKNHELLETFYGQAEFGDCMLAVDEYKRRGYRQVLWAPNKDEDGYQVCEVYGVKPKSKSRR